MDEITKPSDVRRMIREGRWRGPTAGLAPGYVQANLVVLPKDLAYDFLLFATFNPKPCPILDVTQAGSPVPTYLAPEADLRTDIPRYRVYRDGEYVEEKENLLDIWSDDLVAFLLGCSFTFETPLLAAGVPVRHIEENKNVPMFKTNISCRPAGKFHGPLVVSMRPIPASLVTRAVQITARFPAVHGAPVHVGDPAYLGIKDLNKPDYGDPVTIHPGEVPVFWACGVTPQAAAVQAKPKLMITHSPGHMFIGDLKDSDFSL